MILSQYNTIADLQQGVHFLKPKCANAGAWLGILYSALVCGRGAYDRFYLELGAARHDPKAILLCGILLPWYLCIVFKQKGKKLISAKAVPSWIILAFLRKCSRLNGEKVVFSGGAIALTEY